MAVSGQVLAEAFDLSSLLETGLGAEPEAAALWDLHRSISWIELDRASEALALHYRQIGLRPGDPIASLMPNSFELMIHYLAGLRCGLVLTPLNYRYTVCDINDALELSGAKALLHHDERSAEISTSEASRLCELGLITATDQGFTHQLDDSAGSLPWSKQDPDQPCILFLTSGSTGRPKGVTHTWSSMGWLLASLQQSCGFARGEGFLAGSSLSHIAAFILAMGALGRGTTVLVPNTLTGSSLDVLLRNHHPQVIWSVPTILFSLVRDLGLQREDFSAVRLCICGGDKVNHELQLEFKNASGLQIDEMWGMSEVGCATLSPRDAENRIGSVGKLAPGYEASIRDLNGQELVNGQEGLLWIRSKANTVGYWDNPTATAETTQDGWLNTGDVMRFDDDEYLWFCGRRKQIIVHDGSNICPQEVEESLMDHPTVDQACVVGVDDVLHGQNVQAFVVFKDEAPPVTPADLIAFARERVGYKAPDVVRLLPSMPLNSVGKVDRVAMTAMANAQP